MTLKLFHHEEVLLTLTPFTPVLLSRGSRDRCKLRERRLDTRTPPFEQLSLYDMTGRLLLTKPLEPDIRSQMIVLPELPNVVVASLLAKEGVVSRKLCRAN